MQACVNSWRAIRTSTCCAGLHQVLERYQRDKYVPQVDGRMAARETETFQKAGQAITAGLQACRVQARKEGKNVEEVLTVKLNKHGR